MPVYEIPTGPSPRSMSITLPSGVYGVRLAYASVDQGGWFMDILDRAGQPLVCGVPLVTGADLLAQYPDLGIGGKMFVVTDGDPGSVPTFDNLGVLSHLYFEPDA